MYHRVGDPGSPPGKLTVSPQRFGEQLEAIAHRFDIVSLPAIVKGLRNGALPRGCVAVTFDDGYLDNLDQAKPLLDRFDVPATVFVVSGYVDSDKPFWWDELERICLAPPTLPLRLELNIRGRLRSWRSTAERRGLFRELREEFAALPEAIRDELLAQLAEWSGVPTRGHPESMTAEQLRGLAKGGLVEIGAHTVSHPALPALGQQRQIEEIRESREQLGELVGQEVRLFSYPFGAHDQRTVRSARAAGVICACTTIPDGVRPSTDPYRLPRVHVGDWTADEVVAAVSRRLR